MIKVPLICVCEGQELKSSTQEAAFSVPADEIDLRIIVALLWRARWIVLVCTLFAGVMAAGISLLLPNIYQSQVLLAPAEEASGGGLAAISGQLGGLASLAGVNLGKNEVNKTTIAMEVLKSRAFITDFARRREIVVPLMAAEKWDAEHDQLIIDTQIYDAANNRWVVGKSDNKDGSPTNWDIYEEFKKILSVSQAKDSGLVTVSIDFFSPSHARQWVAWLVEDVNAQMRQRDIDEATRSIEYLKHQLEATSIADMQQIFYQLIEKQTQTIMLASVRDQYVFKVIDPPVKPQEKIKPKRILIVLLAMLVVGLISSLVAIVLASNRDQKVD